MRELVADDVERANGPQSVPSPSPKYRVAPPHTRCCDWSRSGRDLQGRRPVVVDTPCGRACRGSSPSSFARRSAASTAASRGCSSVAARPSRCRRSRLAGNVPAVVEDPGYRASLTSEAAPRAGRQNCGRAAPLRADDPRSRCSRCGRCPRAAVAVVAPHDPSVLRVDEVLVAARRLPSRPQGATPERSASPPAGPSTGPHGVWQDDELRPRAARANGACGAERDPGLPRSRRPHRCGRCRPRRAVEAR